MAKESDLVLVYYEDSPLFFARIEDISPDIKPSWYHVKLLVLQVPVQTVTWLLRDVYTNGTEFTMGGKKMRMEQVECPADDAVADMEQTPSEKNTSTHPPIAAKVIPIRKRENP